VETVIAAVRVPVSCSVANTGRTTGNRCRRQFLRKICPIHLAFCSLISCTRSYVIVTSEGSNNHADRTEFRLPFYASIISFSIVAMQCSLLLPSSGQHTSLHSKGLIGRLFRPIQFQNIFSCENGCYALTKVFVLNLQFAHAKINRESHGVLYGTRLKGKVGKTKG
jgi:hypothetical protein